MLKEHYLIEDWPEVLDNIENVFKNCMKAVEMAENAEFSTKEIVKSEINHSIETFIALNRKKLDREVDEQAWTYVGSKTYV
ncbi:MULTISPECIES: hypothetical protein [unclassified Oceanobacillus]|uniref:hypothetical protein n=1 Tax=unclassified Oceanobacillus TaxID=2630292 RepID=UPI001BE8A8B2|nr:MULTISPECIES: hypothetical protein [unclassified Oceanobacillus]MBT2600915.1 hypothetical protein [Oceanobacillus sp. ISL-74]MBT2653424.1 hypothetical protein [Oceanobacillus sp. ISL-73]